MTNVPEPGHLHDIIERKMDQQSRYRHFKVPRGQINDTLLLLDRIKISNETSSVCLTCGDLTTRWIKAENGSGRLPMPISSFLSCYDGRNV